MKSRLGTSSYRLRLIVGFMLVIILVAGAWAYSLYAPLESAVRDQQQQRLTELARAGAVILPLANGTLEDALTEVAGEGDVRFTVVAANGTVLADTQAERAQLENHGDRPEVRAAFEDRIGSDVRRSETQGVDRMYVAVRAEDNDGAFVVVRASESLNRIAALTSEARQAGLWLLPVALALAALAAWWVTQASAGPVERLALAAHTMAKGDLGSPVPDERGPLKPLSSALTELRHELRSRLTALEAEQRTLRIALDGLSDGVVLLDGDRVQLANRALPAMLPLPPGELVGRTVTDLGLPAPLEATILAHLGDEQPALVDLGPDPFQRYQRVTTVPLGREDGVTRTLVAVTDTTESRRLDAVRRDFVANASHELKTPTASILLLAESADQAARDGDDQQALAFLAQVHAEAQRLKTLVVDLLDLSRIESVPDTREVADVRKAVELALAGHRRAAAAKHLALSSDLEAVAGVDVAVRCNMTDLAVALDNLLANAIAYTESGEVSISVEADDDSVGITVADTGIGIPNAEVERVFERFYRVDRARGRATGGTGLGLSLVHNIAERAGGTVALESRLDEGTAVTLRLPRAR